MIRHTLIVCLIVAGCSSPGARTTDAAVADAFVPPPDAPLCGNGRIDGRLDGLGIEGCDDGARNGTPVSQCNRECVHGLYNLFSGFRTTTLPGHAIHDIIDVHLLARDHVVIRDDNGVFLALGLNGQSIGTSYVPPMVQLRGAADATSLAWFRMRDMFTSAYSTYQFPLWIERSSGATGGAQGLYWAYLDEANQPVVRSLPYPFPDGTGGTLITPYGRLPIIVDQSSTPPYDLLVAVMIPRNENDIAFTTARIPSHGRQRGVLAGNRPLDDKVEAYSQHPPPLVHRVLQFFSDTHTFSQIDIRPPSNADPYGAPYSIVESASGDWPFDVTAAADWREAWVDQLDDGSVIQLTHPNPFAVVNADGAIYTWQFNQSFEPSQEGFAVPFAQVPPGSVPYLFDAPMVGTLWVLAPDGRIFYLNDGDPADVTSTSLLPYAVPAIAPWSTAAVANTYPQYPTLFGADDRVYMQ